MAGILSRLLGDEAAAREAAVSRGRAAAQERRLRVYDASTQDFEEIDRRFSVVGHTAPTGRPRSSSRYPELRRRRLATGQDAAETGPK